MISGATLYRLLLKMPKAFGHARAVRDHSEVLVLVLEVDGAAAGIGECVPREYVTGETVDSAFDALCALDLGDLGRQIEATNFAQVVAGIGRLGLPDLLAQGGRQGRAAACAVELALLDVAGRSFSVPLRTLVEVLELPRSLRRRPDEPQPIPLSKAIDFLASHQTLATLDFSPDHIKIKVGADAQADLERVRSVREGVGSRMRISVDANMAWTHAEALRRIEALRPYDIAWYEEPLAPRAWDDYRDLRDRAGVRIMLDESLCSLEDGRQAIARQACDLFNIRISKCGGLLNSFALAALAHEHDVGIQLGVHPGQLGILGAAGAQLLAGVGPLVACEGGGAWIGTGGFPDRVVVEELLLDTRAGRCDGLRPTGLGVTPRMDALERHAIARARWDGTQWLKPTHAGGR